MTLSMFIREKVDFRYVQIWLWVCFSKEKLTLDMSKYDFEYNHERKIWLQITLHNYHFRNLMWNDKKV
jgi:hypothetical protein